MSRLISWNATIMSLLLLSSMLLNSATTPASSTNYGLSPLLALVNSLQHRPEVVKPPRRPAKSPPADVVRQRRARLAELAPLVVAEPLPASKTRRTRFQLLRDRRKSQPKAGGPSPPLAASRQPGLFYRVY